ncbi:MAG: hypothetical protein R3F58_02345 [Steroidobacteraceae bacterium]
MFEHVLLVAHVVVLGYWLGADLVINATYRYVSWSRGMPFQERSRLMEHVMHVDQHVRYALVLQLALGVSLASLKGYLPIGEPTVWVAAVLAAAWIILLELVYRRRHSPSGPLLDTIDLALWVAAGVLLVGISGASAGGFMSLPGWLTLKLALFGGVFLAGVGIRVALMAFFRAWQEVAEKGSSDARETAIRQGYWRATAVLIGLWVLIGAMVVLSVGKPF